MDTAIAVLIYYVAPIVWTIFMIWGAFRFFRS